MAYQAINLGTTDNDNTGDAPKPAGVKINSNFVELYSGVITSNPQTANYTTVLTDAGKSIDVTSSSAVTVTIPLNATVAYATGTTMEITRLGTGSLTLAFTGGITVINPYSSLIFRAQGSTASIRKTGTDTWLVSGDFS
jgi:hypothetical protein